MSGEFPTNAVFSLGRPGFLGNPKLKGGNLAAIGAGVHLAAASFAITGNAVTPVAWDTKDFDTSNFWNVGNPTVFTIPFTGLYLLSAGLTWGTGGGGTCVKLLFRKNASANNFGVSSITLNAADNIANTLTMLLSLVAGDTVTANGSPSGPGNSVLGTNNISFFTILGIH